MKRIKNSRDARVLLVLAAWLGASALFAQTPTADWRFLTSSDAVIDPERISLAMLQVEADFNGDALLDKAAVLMRKDDNNEAGVFVFMASKGVTSRAHQVDGYRFTAGEFMLSVVKPDCYRSDKSTLCLKNAGFLRSEIEYGWGTLYWWEDGQWQKMPLTRGEFEWL